MNKQIILFMIFLVFSIYFMIKGVLGLRSKIFTICGLRYEGKNAVVPNITCAIVGLILFMIFIGGILKNVFHISYVLEYIMGIIIIALLLIIMYLQADRVSTFFKFYKK